MIKPWKGELPGLPRGGNVSEFECRNNHQMSSRDRVCPICGEGCYYMDGLSSQQWRKRDKWEEIQANLEDEEEQPSYEDDTLWSWLTFLLVFSTLFLSTSAALTIYCKDLMMSSSLFSFLSSVAI